MNNKKKKETASEKIIKKVQKLFDEYNISGILKIPNVDIMSNFKTHADKLEIFEFVDIEKRISNELLDKEISLSVTEELNSKTKKSKYTPSYV